MLVEKNTFNGNDPAITTCIPYHEYNEPCEACRGSGHIHGPDCKKEIVCPVCGGSGKKNVYQGSVYKIFWNLH